MATKRKQRVSKAKRSTKKSTSKKGKASLKLVSSGRPKKAKPKTKTQVKTKSAAPAKSTGKKKAAKRGKISGKLLDVLEKRKSKTVGTTPSALFTKPPSRRGRRPKANSEYGQDGRNDDPFQDNENQLQYDTGIKVSYAVDSDVPSFERLDDYDEELNFE